MSVLVFGKKKAFDQLATSQMALICEFDAFSSYTTEHADRYDNRRQFPYKGGRPVNQMIMNIFYRSF